MRFWAFDDKYFSQNNLSIELISGRKVWIGEGDGVIFFNRSYSGLIFKSHGTVALSSLEDIGDDRLQFNAEISDYKKFGEARNLEDFSYSLVKIYRYNSPSIHFKKPYVELNENDFNTLINARIYWPRTAFGIFINCLPKDHIVRFMHQLAETNPDVLLQIADYSEAWKMLKSFIQEEFICAAELFKNLRIIVEQMNNSEDIKIDYSKFGLSSGNENEPPDLIWIQGQLILNFANKLRIDQTKANLLHGLDNKIEQDYHFNENFENNFKGTPWPIQTIRS